MSPSMMHRDYDALHTTTKMRMAGGKKKPSKLKDAMTKKKGKR